jgi:hypothetical protein
VPLSRGHHREAHRAGDEVTRWKKAGLDPTVTARALWLETHPLPTSAGRMAGNARASADNEQKATRDVPISTPGLNTFLSDLAGALRIACNFSRTALNEFVQGSMYARDDLIPRPRVILPKQAGGRIPRAIVAIEQPAPIGDER